VPQSTPNYNEDNFLDLYQEIQPNSKSVPFTSNAPHANSINVNITNPIPSLDPQSNSPSIENRPEHN
jgi:hypothetical protein